MDKAQGTLEVVVAVATGARFWSGKRVLVTGHTGFKGAWLSLWLQELGAIVAGYALAPPTKPSLFELAGIGERLDSTIADVRDLPRLTESLRAFQPEVVFHLAAQAIVRASYDNPIDTLTSNVLGTANLLEAVRQAPSVQSCVVVTSDKCYENREWPWAYRENEAMGGHDIYSASKACAELVTAAYRRSFLSGPGTAAVASARAGNVIGGGDWAADRLVPDCLRSLGQGETVPIRNPHAVRPWQHVLEPLGGYLLLARKLCEDGEAFAESWNFGPDDGDARPVSQLVTTLTTLWGDGACWSADDGDHPHEASVLRVDSSKARQRLGWSPRWKLEQALGRTVEWARRLNAGEPVVEITLDQIRQFESASPTLTVDR